MKMKASSQPMNLEYKNGPFPVKACDSTGVTGMIKYNPVAIKPLGKRLKKKGGKGSLF